MGGADGRLYELKYAAGRNGGCKKVRQTSLRSPCALLALSLRSPCAAEQPPQFHLSAVDTAGTQTMAGQMWADVRIRLPTISVPDSVTAGTSTLQVCHTGGMWDYLPSFLQRASSPIVEIAVDDARGALYARTANSEVK